MDHLASTGFRPLSGGLLFVTLWALASGPAPAQLIGTLPTVENPAAETATLPLSSEEQSQLDRVLANTQWGEAEKLLAAAYERNPGSAALLKALARVSFQNENYWNTAIAYKKAEKIEPLDEQSRFSLAMAYIVLNRGDWAQPELQSLASANPSNPRYLYWLARLDYNNQSFPDAIEKLKRVIDIDASFFRAYDNLGLSLEAVGRRDEAQRMYEKAIELSNKQAVPSAWPSLNLGTMLYRLGRTDEAERYLQEAVRIDPKLAQAQYQLGSLLDAQGKVDEALERISLAAELNPEDPKPHYALGRLYRRQGDKQKARAALKRFVELEKKSKQEITSPR